MVVLFALLVVFVAWPIYAMLFEPYDGNSQLTNVGNSNGNSNLGYANLGSRKSTTNITNKYKARLFFDKMKRNDS